MMVLLLMFLGRARVPGGGQASVRAHAGVAQGRSGLNSDEVQVCLLYLPQRRHPVSYI